MKKEKRKIGNIPIDEMKQEVNDFINEVRENEPVLTDSFESVESPEYSETTLDEERKVISYRKKDGTKVENVGLETPSVFADEVNTNSLKLTPDGMTEFQQALRDSGFNPGGASDWSDYLSNDGEIPLCIPQPRCSVLNIITDYNLTQLSKEGYKGSPAPVEGVTYNIPTEVEFWDMQGNYFKKWTLMSGQGASTMGLPKKSMAFDFFDKSVYNSKGKLGKGDAFKIKFGDWVAQDSFHLKAYLYENTKVKSVGTYQLYEEILKSRGVADDYNWKRGLLDLEAITPTNIGISSIDENLVYLDNGATCFPKGFPVIVYRNGDFWGIYMWQIKKHRDNYKMNKSNANHIHLDGEVVDIFSYDGDIDWDVVSGTKPDSVGITDVLEVRNPKDLYLMDGTKYNADTNAGEFIDATAVGIYDPENADHVRTANVKAALVALSRTTSIINAAKDVYEASEKTQQDLETFKAVFETYFDADNLVDYMILSDSILNWDGFRHNIQWTTWNGVKWFANLYDTDNTFGSNTGGSTPMPPTNTHQGYYNLVMFKIILTYYVDKLESRYSELRKLGIIDANHICEMLTSLQHRINDGFFKMERVKWAASLTDKGYDNIYRIYKFLNAQISNMDTLYHYHA